MKKYPQESVETFVQYVSDVMDEYPYEDYYWIFAALCNDETSDDDTLRAHLFKDGVPPLLIAKLMEVREYFWDFRYVRDYFWNPEYK